MKDFVQILASLIPKANKLGETPRVRALSRNREKQIGKMSGPLSFGRVTAALTSLHNENSASLMAANFDFTLIKVTVPPEFKGLGATISRKRKDDAEDGTVHRTARRLGALFGNILPPTDELFRAYGTRVSEISAMPGINPRENVQRDGIFASHIGADTTSIWAAVTSGSAAIAAHLLGCMLARNFTGPEAISIWVEIVKKQKEYIRGKVENSLYSAVDQATLSATQQDISRSDLATWDASARAWLQSADQAKALQHKQTMLILDNASLPVNTEPETYSSVMKAWTTALEAMNNLVKGIPLRVQDGAALLAMSSWHLYPDIKVYGTSNADVKQKDPLFAPTAILTIGLEHVREDTKSVYWSLPLACLQYYGHPVKTSRTVGQDNSRVSYKQFTYVILGCLFAGWGQFARTNEEGLRWVKMLATAVNKSLTKREAQSSLQWLSYLAAAEQEFFKYEESEMKSARQLMNLGRRRMSFLQPPSNIPPPLFCISQIGVQLSLLKHNAARIDHLRELCQNLGLDKAACPSLDMPRFMIIANGIYFGGNDRVPEYASALPIICYPRACNDKMIAKEPESSSMRFVRWIELKRTQLDLCISRRTDLENIPRAIQKLSSLLETEHTLSSRQDQASIISRDQCRNDISSLRQLIDIGQRRREIEEAGDVCLPIGECLPSSFDDGLVFSNTWDFFEALVDIRTKMEFNHRTQFSVVPRFYFGDARLAAVYSVVPSNASTEIPKPMSKYVVSPEFLEQCILDKKFDVMTLYYRLTDSSYALAQTSSLKAWAEMVRVYRMLPDATISTLVLDQPLYEAKWIPTKLLDNSLTLSQTFACVAMFESGTCNLEPNTLLEVFAMSSGNSLYAAEFLLRDPYEISTLTEIRRVVGNIGKPGISFLVSPPEVKTREADVERWRYINHNPFTGRLENHFGSTSIHLSFTDYIMPLATKDTRRHIIDQPIGLVETLISVYDGGTWVSEVDVLKAVRNPIHQLACTDNHHEYMVSANVSNTLNAPQPAQTNHYAQSVATYGRVMAQYPHLTLTSIENWDELIEPPEQGVVVLGTHKDWLARLAATAMCTQHNLEPIILPEVPCWACCADMVVTQGNTGKLAFIC